MISAGWYSGVYKMDLFQVHSMKRKNNCERWKEMVMAHLLKVLLSEADWRRINNTSARTLGSLAEILIRYIKYEWWIFPLHYCLHPNINLRILTSIYVLLLQQCFSTFLSPPLPDAGTPKVILHVHGAPHIWKTSEARKIDNREQISVTAKLL